MEAAKTKAQSLIDENAVMVFSKSYCPYCRASKKTLQNAGAQFKVYELNEESQYNLPTHQPTNPRPAPPFFTLANLCHPWGHIEGRARHTKSNPNEK